MLRIFSYFLFIIIYSLNKVFFFIFKRNYIGWLIFFLQEKSYKKILLKDQSQLIFFTPNNLIDWRVRTLLSKEPDTIQWIDNFDKNKEIIFWDIGANIGLFSIYSAQKHKGKIKVIAFEPSSSNLRVLTRNISMNNFSNKIFVNQIALTNKKNVFLDMNEPDFIEGSSLNTFGEKFNFEGENFLAKQKYKIFGTTIDTMIDESYLDIPDYIKIDVDGLEHLILEGGDKVFKNKKIKSVLIEVNENFKTQKDTVLKFMLDHNFKFITKENTPKNLSDKFIKTFNYRFERNDE
ncbi:FkbM family methyltransferase [Pelagibacterales bacterium SAG-MED11]|nr:FkbM family methyltransferase [Pelagibacterales bacterium SAG-MED11]